MACYDIEGNTVDCTDSGAIGVADTTGIGDVNAGLNLTSNPVAASVASPSGTSILSNTSFFTSLANLGASITSAVVGKPTATSGLILQVNPATGLQQYYNPTTGLYVGSPITASGNPLGSSSFLLVIVALVVAFFAFGSSKRATA